MSYNHKRLILYIVLLIALIIVLTFAFFIGIVISHLQIKPETTLNECFYYQPKIVYYPDIYVLGTLIEAVIQCESSGRHYDSNGDILRGKAGEYGICQFKQKTWDMFNKERETNLDITSEEDQKSMIVWAFEQGYESHWTCYNNL